MPTYLLCLRQAEMAKCNITFTAGSRSSKVAAIGPPLSRSTPKVNWVISFEPIEKPSKYCKNCSANKALLGNSHIIIRRKPFLPRSKPLAFKALITASASVSVRTNGIMISTLVKPISSRTRFKAWHSKAKHSLKSSDT